MSCLVYYSVNKVTYQILLNFYHPDYIHILFEKPLKNVLLVCIELKSCAQLNLEVSKNGAEREGKKQEYNVYS